MATVVAALVLTTIPVYAQTSAVPAMAGGMSTQEIMQAGASNPWAAHAHAERTAQPAATASEPAQAPASAPQQRSVPFWALAAWVSVGVALAFGYLLRRRVW
ncbi:MAG: hypothetical protein JNK87_01090 [Bryobacterales bacterium]|nr:hypothetical protein [Bryobacterales bacterium]